MTENDNRTALPSGTKIQDYKLRKELGRGGFGITYLGLDTRGLDTELQIQVAVKEYFPKGLAVRKREPSLSVVEKSSEDKEDFKWGLERFKKEAKAIAKVAQESPHRNVVQFKRVFPAHGTAYIVMEFVEGETLEEFLERRGRLKEEELREILIPLLAGLSTVHAKDIMHRDIKPKNIILREKSRLPVLVDFGLAREMAVDADSPYTAPTVTWGYSPIEQCQGDRKRQGAWTDIYALGAVCYQSLVGKIPVEAMGRAYAIEQRDQDPLEPAAQAAHGRAEAGFLKAIDWALEVEPEDRPKSLEAWREALEGVPEKREERRDEHPTSTAQEAASQAQAEEARRKEQEAVRQAQAEEARRKEQEAASQAQAEEARRKAQAEEQAKGLLAGAEADLSARRLTGPEGNNAWEKYQAVLRLFPGDARAQAGMKRVLAGYRELFGKVLVRRDFEQAGVYLSRIRGLRPDSPFLAEGERRLSEAKAKAGAEAEVKAVVAALAGEMVKIPGGRFRMGGRHSFHIYRLLVDRFRMGDLMRDLTVGGWVWERPRHSVTVPSFRMGKHEVTFSQWDACVADGGCSHTPGDEGWGRGNRPVINVSWDDIQEFIVWLNTRTGGGYRLPTESEWEYAARAGSESLYSWGDEFGDNRANCDGCGSRRDDKRTASVGNFPANEWGLHDMHGNVYEWVEDCWNDNYGDAHGDAPDDGSAWLRGDCRRRVVRGGCWYGDPWYMRSSSRYNYNHSDRSPFVGFRLARDSSSVRRWAGAAGNHDERELARDSSEEWRAAPEGGRAPEKREERREEQPAAVPVLRSVRRWVRKPVARLVAVLVIVGGGYFVGVQWWEDPTSPVQELLDAHHGEVQWRKHPTPTAQEEERRPTEEARRKAQEAASQAQAEEARRKEQEAARQAQAEEARRKEQEAARQAQAEEQVKSLLAGAEADLSARRLTHPAGNNAWEKYEEVLRQFPGDARARAGMERVLAGYMELFGEVLARGDLAQAGAYLSRIRGLHPDSPLLAEGERRLAEAESEAEARAKARAEARAKARAEAEATAAVLAREIVEIPGGRFRMGDLSVSGSRDERPVHSVTVSSFRMGKHEVTFSQWDVCVADGGCSHRPDDEGFGRGNRPVINVSWDDVQEFIAWLNARTDGGYRLPTESEWEYAARAGSKSLYSWRDWGDGVGVNRANCTDCGSRWDRTAPVGSFPANAWGFHDMHGNVYEWVEDCWNRNYRGAPVDGSAWESGDCSLRVTRGGSWLSSSRSLRSANRSRAGRSTRDRRTGFRLARDN